MVSCIWNGLKGMEEVNVLHLTEWFVRDLFWAQPGSSGTARGKMSVGCACPKLMGRLRQQIETWGPKIQS